MAIQKTASAVAGGQYVVTVSATYDPVAGVSQPLYDAAGNRLTDPSFTFPQSDPTGTQADAAWRANRDAEAVALVSTALAEVGAGVPVDTLADDSMAAYG